MLRFNRKRPPKVFDVVRRMQRRDRNEPFVGCPDRLPVKTSGSLTDRRPVLSCCRCIVCRRDLAHEAPHDRGKRHKIATSVVPLTGFSPSVADTNADLLIASLHASSSDSDPVDCVISMDDTAPVADAVMCSLQMP